MLGAIALPVAAVPERVQSNTASESVVLTQPTEDRIVERVVTAVADVTGTRPLDLPPLYDALDADVLDSLCRSAGDAVSEVSVTFRYATCTVTVEGADELTVTAAEA